MTSGVQLDGGATLVASLEDAARALGSMDEAAAAAARFILDSSSPGAPRQTGRLAASVRSDVVASEPVVFTDLPYGPVIHWGWAARHITARPWIQDSVIAHQDQLVGIYAEQAQVILGNVKGT
jgi:hypothetical protein